MSQDDGLSGRMVAEIFTEIGIAFSRIGEFAMMANSKFGSPHNDKITDADVQIVAAAVSKFSEDIEKMCHRMKDKTLLVVGNSMKREAFEEAGLPLGKRVKPRSRSDAPATPKTAVIQKKVSSSATVNPQSSAK